jgi:hypothetical protein
VNHSFSRGRNLSVLLSLAATLAVFSVLYTGIFAYGQESDSLGNPLPQVNNNTNQVTHSEEKQQLVIIPSLSSNELSTVIVKPEPSEEIRRLEQGLVSQRTGIDFIEEDREKAEDAPDSISAAESEEQQEDTQGKLEDKLDAAESKTSETVEDTIRESENIQNEQNDDTNGKGNKETGKDSGVPIELPFP